MSDTMTHAYIGDIVKSYRDEQGDLVVYGKAAGPDLDLDGERCDPNWLRREVPAWFEWGNVREQHSQIAAGVGIEIENTGDDWHIKAKVTDPTTAHKVETGTLKGWSLGAIDTKTYKDARGQTWLTGGKIIEFSLVDRPCNPTTTLAVAKSAGDGDWSPVSSAGEVIASIRTKAAKLDLPRGAAGSQKTADVDEQPAAAFDRALALEVAAKIRSKDRAAALKLVEASVSKAVAADGLQDEAPDIAKGKQVIDLLGQLIAAEAAELGAGYLDETCDINLLVQATECVKWWLAGEQKAEDEPEPPYAQDDEDEQTIVYIGLSASRGVVFKYVSQAKRDEYAKSGVAMPNGDFPIPDEGHLKSAVGHWEGYTGDKAAAKKHIIARAKALGLTKLLPDDWEGGSGDDSKGKAVEAETEKAVEADTTKTTALDAEEVQKIAKAAAVEATKAAQVEIESLRGELAKIKSTAIPGGPYIVAPPVGASENGAVSKAAGYRELARNSSDPAIREAYNALADQVEETAPARR